MSLHAYFSFYQQVTRVYCLLITINVPIGMGVASSPTVFRPVP